MDTLINEGHKNCETRWSDAEYLLTYLDLPILEPISQAPLPKLQLEQVEQRFDANKELIQQINLVTIQEIKRWIEFPHASIACI